MAQKECSTGDACATAEGVGRAQTQRAHSRRGRENNHLSGRICRDFAAGDFGGGGGGVHAINARRGRSGAEACVVNVAANISDAQNTFGAAAVEIIRRRAIQSDGKNIFSESRAGQQPVTGGIPFKSQRRGDGSNVAQKNSAGIEFTDGIVLPVADVEISVGGPGHLLRIIETTATER